MSKIRFAILLKRHGPVKLATACTDEEWKKACADGRIATVYHAENDWMTPVEGIVNHHGACNTICKIMWAAPLPAGVDTIIGMRENQDAWDLFHGHPTT